MTQRPAESTDDRHTYLHTSCGREVTVGRLALGDLHHPSARVFVHIASSAGCEGTGWAGFSVTEAKALAEAILSQAAAAERDRQTAELLGDQQDTSRGDAII
jgi:hypothetical protein